MAGERDERTPRGVAGTDAWPQGPFPDDAPIEIRVAAHVAILLGSQIEAVAQASGVATDDIVAVVNGDAWPDTWFLGRIEAAIGLSVWPADT